MSETMTPQAPEQPQEGLSPQEENSALFWRNQQKGIVHNMEDTSVRLAGQEGAAQPDLSVVKLDKAQEIQKEELEHFHDQAKLHYDARPEAYQETARREAEAEGHKINR